MSEQNPIDIARQVLELDANQLSSSNWEYFEGRLPEPERGKGRIVIAEWNGEGHTTSHWIMAPLRGFHQRVGRVKLDYQAICQYREAAPVLANTVIEQAAEIEQMKADFIQFLDDTYTNYRLPEWRQEIENKIQELKRGQKLVEKESPNV